MDLQQRIESIIEGPVQHEGYRIVRIRFLGLKTKVIQIMIERLDDQPITVDDCANVSRMVSVHLDVENPIDEHYVLEISSTGIERPLVKPHDFDRYKGNKVAFHLYAPLENRKKWIGTILGMENEQILFEVPDDLSQDTKQLEVDFANIKSCHLFFESEQQSCVGGKGKKTNQRKRT